MGREEFDIIVCNERGSDSWFYSSMAKEFISKMSTIDFFSINNCGKEKRYN